MSASPAKLPGETRGTELVDPRYADIEQRPIQESLRLQVEAQREALNAVEEAIPQMEPAIIAAIKALKGTKGRLIYVGAGTSGRLGIQDGVELTPTFNWHTERCEYLMAGGPGAVFRSVEGAEDNAEAGREGMKAFNLTPNDVVIGIAASGTTPFTIAAMYEATKAGAVTIGIANNRGAPLFNHVTYPVCAHTGSEVIAGSTRLKAGTAQKNMLNMISNQIMMGLGKVYNGLMVDMRASNVKLKNRAVDMVCYVTNCSRDFAQAALGQTNFEVKPASLVTLGTSPEGAQFLLEKHPGWLGDAIKDLRSHAPFPAVA